MFYTRSPRHSLKKKKFVSLIIFRNLRLFKCERGSSAERARQEEKEEEEETFVYLLMTRVYFTIVCCFPRSILSTLGQYFYEFTSERKAHQ